MTRGDIVKPLHRKPGKMNLIKLFSLICLIFPVVCDAQQNEALAQAQTAFNKSIVAVNEAQSQCDDIATTLPSTPFKKLDIPTQHLKTAISYFYFKAYATCTHKAVTDHLAASAVGPS